MLTAEAPMTLCGELGGVESSVSLEGTDMRNAVRLGCSPQATGFLKKGLAEAEPLDFFSIPTFSSRLHKSNK